MTKESRINEGQINAYFRRAASMAPDNADYNAAYANALVEFDRIPMAVRQLHKLVEIGKASDGTDVSFHLYEAARGLIEAMISKLTSIGAHQLQDNISLKQ